MKKSILITRTEDDEITRYCSKWIEYKTKPEAERKGFDVIDLNKNKAVRNQVESIMLSKKPPLVLFHGHGNDNIIAGYQHQTLIHSEENAHILGEKIIHSLTCNSASILGHKAVEEHNALAFIGYREPFIALTDDYSASRPLADVIAKPFLESAMKVGDLLVKGNTAGEAFKKSQDTYALWIAYYRANDQEKEASDILLYLMADKNAQILIGNPDASVSPD